MPTEFKWKESLQERLGFYTAITLSIVIDALFLLAQRAIVRGFNWCLDKISGSGHSAEATWNILKKVFDWSTLLIVCIFIIVDLYRVGRKLLKHGKDD